MTSPQKYKRVKLLYLGLRLEIIFKKKMQIVCKRRMNLLNVYGKHKIVFKRE